jgi:two-component system response regulator YesN
VIDVLIIDDEIWVTRLLEKLIRWEDLGFRIVGVYHDGREGLAGIRELRPHLVLTDIRMPGITGLDIMRETQENGDAPMFIIISGYNDFEYAQTALSYGALGYLLKPIDQKELEKYISKAQNLHTQKQRKWQEEQALQNSMGQMTENLRERVFLNLFEGVGNPEEDISSLNSVLRLNLMQGDFITAGVFLDTEDRAAEVKELITRTIWKVNLPAYCYEMLTLPMPQEMLLVLNYAEGTTRKIEQSLFHMFDEVLSSKPACGVTLGIGEPVGRIGELSQSYRQLREMQMSRLVHGSNRVYNSRTEPRTSQDENQMLYPTFDISLKQAFNGGHASEVAKLTGFAVDRFMAKAQKYPVLLMRGVSRLLALYEVNAAFAAEKYPFSEKRRALAGAGSVGQIKQMLAEIAAELIAARAGGEAASGASAMQKALEYIENSYTQDISLSDVAEVVNLNPNYFSEVFKRETGVNFKEYLISKRIGSAKELLRNPAYKLNEIAELTGYNDTKNFGRSFKKTIGVTPMEYRKLMTGNGQ